MNLQWVALCRYAESNYGHGATLVGVGVETMELPSFPYEASLWVAVCFTAHYQELEPTTIHEISYRLVNEELTERDADTMRFRLMEAPGPGHRPGWDALHVEPLKIKFEVQEPGAHTLTVVLDGQPPGKSIPVVFLRSGELKLPGGVEGPAGPQV